MLSKLKYKSLVCLESLLEGNRDNTILKKIMNVIDIKSLKLNLSKIYEKYFSIHKD